jgi:hypothetical protein
MSENMHTHFLKQQVNNARRCFFGDATFMSSADILAKEIKEVWWGFENSSEQTLK